MADAFTGVSSESSPNYVALVFVFKVLCVSVECLGSVFPGKEDLAYVTP